MPEKKTPNFSALSFLFEFILFFIFFCLFVQKHKSCRTPSKKWRINDWSIEFTFYWLAHWPWVYIYCGGAFDAHTLQLNFTSIDLCLYSSFIFLNAVYPMIKTSDILKTFAIHCILFANVSLSFFEIRYYWIKMKRFIVWLSTVRLDRGCVCVCGKIHRSKQMNRSDWKSLLNCQIFCRTIEMFSIIQMRILHTHTRTHIPMDHMTGNQGMEEANTDRVFEKNVANVKALHEIHVQTHMVCWGGEMFWHRTWNTARDIRVYPVADEIQFERKSHHCASWWWWKYAANFPVSMSIRCVYVCIERLNAT